MRPCSSHTSPERRPCLAVTQTRQTFERSVLENELRMCKRVMSAPTVMHHVTGRFIQ